MFSEDRYKFEFYDSGSGNLAPHQENLKPRGARVRMALVQVCGRRQGTWDLGAHMSELLSLQGTNQADRHGSDVARR